MSVEEEQLFESAREYHMYGEEHSNEDGEVRVRDHCHITGKYRGSAHQDCDLKLRIDAKLAYF